MERVLKFSLWYLKVDDEWVKYDVVSEINEEELRQACYSRGLRGDTTKEVLQLQLQDWIADSNRTIVGLALTTALTAPREIVKIYDEETGIETSSLLYKEDRGNEIKIKVNRINVDSRKELEATEQKKHIEYAQKQREMLMLAREENTAQLDSVNAIAELMSNQSFNGKENEEIVEMKLQFEMELETKKEKIEKHKHVKEEESLDFININQENEMSTKSETEKKASSDKLLEDTLLDNKQLENGLRQNPASLN